MSINRIKIITKNTGKRFYILYGAGIEDSFLTETGEEINFEGALLQELKNAGYERVAFIAPHKPVYFLDEDSRMLTYGSLDKPQPGDSERSPYEMVFLSGGPLQNRLLLQPATVLQSPQSMGDLHAIRLLDSILRETQIRSAVVFLQAESLILNLDDTRLLAGIMGEWTRLPARNQNCCFFSFSADTYEDLQRFMQNMPAPEIRTAALRKRQNSPENREIFQVRTPDQDEITRLIGKFHQECGMALNSQQIPLLSKWMSSEGLLLRDWAARLNQIRYLDIAGAKKEGWFSAVQNLEIPLEERLNKLTGLQKVKDRIFELSAWLKLEKQKSHAIGEDEQGASLHMIFTGNPGTGKTTVARLFGEILHETGYLRRGHLVEVTGGDLISDHVGGTPAKTNSVIDRALDGILFIDEAYTLTETERGSFGQEAIDTLLTRMENERGRLVVIAAGYPEKMSTFRRANPGLNRRFPMENTIHFDDFSVEELFTILHQYLEQKELFLTDDAESDLRKIIQILWEKRDSIFGNAGEMRNLAEALARRRAARMIRARNQKERPLQIPSLLPEDIPVEYRKLLPSERPQTDEILGELDNLVGLAPIKEYIEKIINRIRLEQLRMEYHPEINSSPAIRHLVFIGNPGTGKTTVARLIGKLYFSLGLLNSGHCIEVTRGDLVAGYVGQTAQKTIDCIQRALDGVLFIDEAYSLATGGEDDFGQEVVDTLVKAIEDYNDRLVVILAGYSESINRLVNRNPGLRSRFASPLVFPDLSGDEMIRLFKSQAEKEKYIIPDKALEKAMETLQSYRAANPRNFGNARAVLDLIDQVKNNLAQRVMTTIKGKETASDPLFLFTVEPEDIPEPVYALHLPGSPSASLFSSPQRTERKKREDTPPVKNLSLLDPMPGEESQANGDTTPNAAGGFDDLPAPPAP